MKLTTAVFLLAFVRLGAPRPSPRAAAASRRSRRRRPATRPARRNRRRKRREVSQTSHTMRLDGRDIKYTATAGTLPIRLDNGQVAARMFFVAYTKDGEDAKTRPVSFLYNGGPGAATIWLHMGSFAPKHVQMADEGFQPAPPYHLVDNENSLLDVTDMVFVDAIDTGYSRVVAGVNNRAVPRPVGRPARVRRVHQRLPEDLQPLAVAEVSDRRKLRHDPVGRAVAGDAEAPRHRAERHRRWCRRCSRTRRSRRRRTTTSRTPRTSRPTRRRVVSQEAAGRPAAGDLKQVVDESRTFAFGEYMTRADARATR